MGIDVSFDSADTSIKGQIHALMLLLLVAAVAGVGLVIGMQLGSKVV